MLAACGVLLTIGQVLIWTSKFLIQLLERVYYCTT